MWEFLNAFKKSFEAANAFEKLGRKLRRAFPSNDFEIKPFVVDGKTTFILEFPNEISELTLAAIREQWDQVFKDHDAYLVILDDGVKVRATQECVFCKEHCHRDHNA